VVLQNKRRSWQIYDGEPDTDFDRLASNTISKLWGLFSLKAETISMKSIFESLGNRLKVWLYKHLSFYVF
jgi:hypothetical protein